MRARNRVRVPARMGAIEAIRVSPPASEVGAHVRLDVAGHGLEDRVHELDPQRKHLFEIGQVHHHRRAHRIMHSRLVRRQLGRGRVRACACFPRVSLYSAAAVNAPAMPEMFKRRAHSPPRPYICATGRPGSTLPTAPPTHVSAASIGQRACRKTRELSCRAIRRACSHRCTAGRRRRMAARRPFALASVPSSLHRSESVFFFLHMAPATTLTRAQARQPATAPSKAGTGSP